MTRSVQRDPLFDSLWQTMTPSATLGWVQDSATPIKKISIIIIISVISGFLLQTLYDLFYGLESEWPV